MKTLSNFEQIAKKNKRKNWLKIVSLCTLVTLIVTGGTYYTLEKIASNNAEKVMHYYTKVSEIAFPNIDYISWGYQATSPFSGEFYSNRVKDIDGITVPFEKYKGSYSILLSSTFNQENYLKTGDNGHSYYTYGNLYKTPIFYNTNHKKEEAHLKITQDLDFIPKMTGQAVEVAITFDKPYTLEEIYKKIPSNLKLNWIWIGQYTNVDFGGNLANQFGFTPYFDLNLNAEQQKAMEKELDATGKKNSDATSEIFDKYNQSGQVTPLEGLQNSFSIFIDNVQTFLDAGNGFDSVTDENGENYSTDQFLKDYLETNKNPQTATFAGIILTGRAENFAQLQNADWIYASNIGQSIQIQPYHQLEK